MITSLPMLRTALLLQKHYLFTDADACGA